MAQQENRKKDQGNGAMSLAANRNWTMSLTLSCDRTRRREAVPLMQVWIVCARAHETAAASPKPQLSQQSTKRLDMDVWPKAAHLSHLVTIRRGCHVMSLKRRRPRLPGVNNIQV
ncbi:hypothetical protein CDD82_4788 [Ophiocordyceps australis]|uniref:Uncharacterized protein n=1 Tax=Ophiocordyceps australis TaxID=1399860 RepID=A0A2C5Y9M8_9HYPO|nr:hypothetical protein CDD82_4788 [Ophiocordyceps australis]